MIVTTPETVRLRQMLIFSLRMGREIGVLQSTLERLHRVQYSLGELRNLSLMERGQQLGCEGLVSVRATTDIG